MVTESRPTRPVRATRARKSTVPPATTAYSAERDTAGRITSLREGARRLSNYDGATAAEPRAARARGDGGCPMLSRPSEGA